MKGGSGLENNAAYYGNLHFGHQAQVYNLASLFFRGIFQISTEMISLSYVACTLVNEKRHRVVYHPFLPGGETENGPNFRHLNFGPS